MAGNQAMKYRKKPVVIDAMQWEGTALAPTPIIDWMLANGGTARYHEAQEEGSEDNGDGTVSVWNADTEHLSINTLEGTMRAEVGDWIIRGVKGEFYPCKPDIFAATYEPADLPTDWSGTK